MSLPIVIGPTASGKSLLGHHLAIHCQSRVINADSMQVYRELPCLSAQPDVAFRQSIPYHLLGYRGVEDAYSAGHWYRDVITLLETLPDGERAVFVGGTGMYLKILMRGIMDCPAAPEVLRSVIRDTMEEVSPPVYHRLLSLYNPDLVEKIHPHDRLRLLRAAEVWMMTGQTPKHLRQQNADDFQENPAPYSFFIIALMPPRDELYPRINDRFLQMLADGATEEVRSLLKHNLTPHHPAMKMIGVPEIAAFLSGEISEKQMIEMGMQASRRYAKRQMTWLRHQVIPDVVLPYCVTESSLKKSLATVLDAMAKKTVQKNDAQEKTTCVKY